MIILRRLFFWWMRMDWLMVLTMLLLLGIGVAFIYSASYRGADVPVSRLYVKQLVWVMLGVGVFLFMTQLDYQRLCDLSFLIYFGNLLLLILVLIPGIGKKVYGAYRWLVIAGIQIQPSELAKVGTIICLAVFLSRPGLDVESPMTLVKALGLVGLPIGLIILEPDLGTAVVLIPVTVIMLLVAGFPLRFLLGLAGVGAMLLPLVWFFGLHDYQKGRLLVFLHPEKDPLGAGWNSMQSVIAVGSGGFFGKGFLNGTQNVLGFLPRTVAPNDFIFSVIAEETGFVGSTLLLLLFVLLLFTCHRTAELAADSFGRLLAAGVGVMLFCHIFVNVGMTIGVMPITGLPLPLISYGGSFSVSTMLALGLVSSVFVRRIQR